MNLEEKEFSELFRVQYEKKRKPKSTREGQIAEDPMVYDEVNRRRRVIGSYLPYYIDADMLVKQKAINIKKDKCSVNKSEKKWGIKN